MRKAVVCLLALAVFYGIAAANPANPRPRVYTQPDGTTFTARLMGDEHYHFWRTLDGYSLAQNAQGYWTYARYEDGLLVPTEYIVGKSSPPFQKNLCPNPAAFLRKNADAMRPGEVPDEMRHEWAVNTIRGSGGKAPGGRRKLLVIVVQFSDTLIQTPNIRGHMNWFMFGSDSLNSATWSDSTGNTGSPDSSKPGTLSNYYWNMTYSNIRWVGHVTTTYSLGNSQSYYGNNTQSLSNPNQCNTTNTEDCSARVVAMISSALTAANPKVNYADYDSDNDGYTDNVAVCFAGSSEDMGITPASVWSASWTSLTQFATLDGKNIKKVFVCSELGDLGVYCHEMLHQLGAPDLYDYGYGGSPWGSWSLMDAGSWNGNPGGSQPCFPGGHLMWDLDGKLGNGVDGWFTYANGRYDSIPRTTVNTDGKYRVASSDSMGLAAQGLITSGVRVWKIYNPAMRDSSQCFLLENRTKTGPYESGLPEPGILISHIDTRMDASSTTTSFNDGPGKATGNKRCYYSWLESPGFDPNPKYASWAVNDTGTGGDIEFTRYVQELRSAYSADDYNLGGWSETALDTFTVPDCIINTPRLATPKTKGPGIYDISREGPLMTFRVRRTNTPASGALIGLAGKTILDPQASFPNNNNNGLFDPWELCSLKLTFKNDGGGGIGSGARCSLYVVKGSNGIDSISTGWKTVGSGRINAGAQATSEPFVVAISRNAPRFLDMTFAAKFEGDGGSYRDTIYFNARIAPLNVVFTYDFQNIWVLPTGLPGADYYDMIQPSDCAVFRDTLYVGNANLGNVGTASRIYRVKKNTTNNPLVGGDTLGSFRNNITVNTGGYVSGMDIDNQGNLLWSLADTLFSVTIPDYATGLKKRLPSVSAWGGSPMKRFRGIAFGPSVCDTVGPGDYGPDTLWGYYQRYGATGDENPANWVESLYCIGYTSTAPLPIRFGRGWNDSIQYLPDNPEYGAGYGGDWWNGRGVEYDGMHVWTTSVWSNQVMKKDPYTGATVAVIPGPSSGGSYGTYGLTHEATDSMGVPYAPTGTVPYVPGAKGTKHYMYFSSMDEGKIYKVNVTSYMVPTSCDSVKVTDMGGNVNKIKWWKANADKQQIMQYIIFRQPLGTTIPPREDQIIATVSSTRNGLYVSTVDSFNDTYAGKALAAYNVLPVNHAGRGAWGASVNANPLAVELAEFSCLVGEGNQVNIRWTTASEENNYLWEIERSVDNETYVKIGELPAAGNSPMGASYSFTDPSPANGLNYYRLVDVSLDGIRTYHGPISVLVGRPMAYALAQNYPNPIGRGVTTIKYALRDPGRTSLRIYNVMGQVVRTLVESDQQPNYYSVTWDGCNGKGKPVANGVYFYKLSSGDFADTKKMMVVR